MPMIVPLVMMGNIIQDPNGVLVVVLSIIPFTSTVAMPSRLAVEVLPAWQINLAGWPFSRILFLKSLTGRFD